MSLITEALKRTRDASRQSIPVPSGSVGVPACQSGSVGVPACATTQKPKSPSRIHPGLWALLGAALLVGAAGAYALWRPMPATVLITKPARPTEETPVTRVVEKIKAEQAVPDFQQPEPTPNPSKEGSGETGLPSTGGVEGGSAVSAVPVNAPPPPRELPKLTLQGIARDAAGHEALINNHSARVGDEIEGARVTAIEDGVVKLIFDGKDIVLRLR